jgi:hypothetical protein
LILLTINSREMKQNLTQFTKRFRSSAAVLAEELGLIESTSKRQKELGTLEFVDPVASSEGLAVRYQMSESGWTRRREVYTSASGRKWRSLGQLLNERVTTKTGKTFRVRAERNEQLALLLRGVVSYRKLMKEDQV